LFRKYFDLSPIGNEKTFKESDAFGRSMDSGLTEEKSMSLTRVFLVLSTNHIGGSEKRFVGLWQAAHENKELINLFLVITPTLKKHLEGHKEFRDALNQHASFIRLYQSKNGFANFKKSIREFLVNCTTKKDIIHFVGDHPFIGSDFRRNIFSVTTSSLSQFNLKGKLGNLLGVFLSDRIDILDPSVTRLMRKYFWYKRSRIFQTSNSYCETSHYYPDTKKDWLVFLGRFEKMKQFLPFIKALPVINREIKHLANEDLHFYVLGHGTEEQKGKEMLAGDDFRDIPVTMTFVSDPSEILNRSRVFFSLQLYNNYPSRSLLEALSSGNIAIVTNNGDTKDIALPFFSYYVPESFTSEQLAAEVVKVFALSKEESRQKQEAARNFVLANHSLARMKAYYFDIYRSMI